MGFFFSWFVFSNVGKQMPQALQFMQQLLAKDLNVSYKF